MKRYLVLLPILMALAGLAVLFCLPARELQPAQAAVYAPDRVIVVNTLQDEWNSDGDCSLREAVAAANINAAVDVCPAGQVLTDTITFGVAGTITVTSQLSVTASGPLVIDGGEAITISGGGKTRVWRAEPGSELTLQRLAVVDGFGGGLYNNNGKVTIANSTFSGNSGGEYGGGGVENAGTLTIDNSTFSHNRGSRGAGAIRNVAGTLTIANSTFSGNVANRAASCISSDGIVTIANSTFSGNSSSFTTIAVISGGAVLTNTIVANESSRNCDDFITDGGHNLDSDGTCGLDPAKGSLPNTDPLLGPLQDNGGPTWTHALLPGSPAIDAGDNFQCLPTDQRGFYRRIDGDGDGIRACDMGAYEYGSVGPWGIHLFPSHQHGGGVPGATLDYHIVLDNNTEITDTYNLESGPHVWETSLSVDTLGPLPSGGSQVFTVTVIIPPEAAWSQFDTVVITATSVTSPTEYTTSAQVTTQAYPLYYLPIMLKEQQAGNPASETKAGRVGLLTVVFSGWAGVGLWLRKKYEGG